MVTGLIYIGDGTALIGVPTRNLTDEEVKKFGKRFLLKSGLYAEPFSKPTKSAIKKEGDALENEQGESR